MHCAARNSHLEVAKLLIVNGAEVDKENKWNETPLHCAAEHGHLAVVILLLEHGAELDGQDSERDTFLHKAVKENNYRLVEEVLKHLATLYDSAKHSLAERIAKCDSILLPGGLCEAIQQLSQDKDKQHKQFIPGNVAEQIASQAWLWVSVIKVRDNRNKTVLHYLREKATTLNEQEEAILSAKERTNKDTIDRILAMHKENIRQYYE